MIDLIGKKTKNLIKIDEVREIVFSKKIKVENIDVDFVDFDSIETDSIVIEINEFLMKEAQKKKLRYRKKLKIEHDFSAEITMK